MSPFRFPLLPALAVRSLLLLPPASLLLVTAAYAQQPAASRTELRGTVRDAAGQPLEQVAVAWEGLPGGTNTDANGRFRLPVPRLAAGQAAVLVVRRLGYATQRRTFSSAQLAEGTDVSFSLKTDARSLNDVTVRGRREEDTREQISITQLDPRTAKELPSAFGDFNKVLTTLPGVVANNELTSTYSVRGGNYDENLVYVNGIEVYRPFLVTAAQQEGLSFVNPDLVDRVQFASGGWQPRYGDKLSSVLTIDYKQPQRRAASATASLVGGALHLEEVSKSGRVSYLAGVRYKNAEYVLRGLRQNQGAYDPTFVDGQAYVTIGLGPATDLQRTSLGVLATVAHNNYKFAPQTGQVNFSSGLNQVQRLTIFYDGYERMQYDTYQGGLNLTHHFTPSLTGEVILSGMVSREQELRDIEAAYTFADINRDPSSKDYNLPVRQRDVGSRFDHSRNSLLARIGNLEARGTYTPSERHTVRWGVKAGVENIHDKLNEYSFVDSADYVPANRFTRLVSDLTLASERYQAYVQHTLRFDSLRTLTYGVRAHYWSVNGQLVASPRVQYAATSRRNRNLSYKAAAGLYYQPPFYRELRNQQGQLNRELRAQRSVHFITGTEYRFRQWGRPFQFTGEVYFKYLTDVVPYDVESVRLRYFAQNLATAYAAGLDARVSGEFVPGAESWFSLGLLTTRENLKGDSVTVRDSEGTAIGKKEQGYIRRPTDQRLNLGVYFQDHLPDNPSVRGYVNLVFGTGLPFSPPGLPEDRGTTKLTRSYKRVDLGASKVLSVRSDRQRKFYQPETLWLGVEVLNVLYANNVAGYSYVQDLNGRTYAVPNYLSRRILNLRLIARF
ncbi:TonB-dependent receptor [Hymenobacter busanensis]|uniref:TonB-dependent receptor n=1 Tax=Hymenobacter busanensis TaxID=2607656 RepID=A0A7L4ZTF4_9BACT|nr:TonB-dependent receptor [Hymenobacter busanensis]KAA9339846.1 TonB-dependent receptor [Hymenobacter busanensis]QHJ06401.1 TonB-dependent receptor plug domain-containing protein [Hymenobacter busanensis]